MLLLAVSTGSRRIRSGELVPSGTMRRACAYTAAFLFISCIWSAEATGEASRQARGKGVDSSALHAAVGVRKRSKATSIPGCAIYVLDLNRLAQENDISTCQLEDIVVDARTQVPYLKEYSTANKAKRVIPTPHYFSGNSAPWFTRRAIERSQYWTTNIHNASVILVDDYCYKLWWLSYIHSNKQDQLPGEYLLSIYKHMMEQPEWSNAKGGHHVFFQSHTGFAHGPLGDFYERFLCNSLVNSMHIVNVRASRLRCKKVPYNPRNFLIAPGSVHYHDIHEFQEREMERLHNREGENFHHERDFLLFFKGKCTPLNFTWKAEAVNNKIAESIVNVGKLMRVHIVRQIQGMGQDIRAACTGDADEMKEVQNERPHWEQMDEFTRSTFCLLVAGDSQTSRRLPEAIMAGCIPVFPGPPYHTMPFAGLVDYSKFALFYRFKSAPWASSITVHWDIDAKNMDARPHHPTDAEWWVPDVSNIEELVIDVEDPAAMVKHLREIPESEVARKQQAVLAVQPQFAYLERGSSTAPSASELIAQAICERWQTQKGGDGQLIDPQPIPASFLNEGAAVQTAAALNSGNPAATQETSKSNVYTEDLQALVPKPDPASAKVVPRLPVEQAKSSLEQVVSDPAGVIGERARKRRRRRKERPAMSVAEHLGQDGRWQVGPN